MSLLSPAPADHADRPIHGNLFGDQILWDGRRLGIVDWDRLALGDPLYDVGRLLAHLLYEALTSGADPARTQHCADSFLRSYGDHTGTDPRLRHLTWHVAVELLLRAKISSLRPLLPQWPSHCRSVVGECERLLSGRSALLALPPLTDTVAAS